jgi:hypothetical protein
VNIVKSSRDGRRMVEVEATVSDWFYNALIGKEVLTISRDYFRLRKPLERRLYELARKHCGRQPEWNIGLETLKEKSGYLSPLKKFRYQLREIIKTNGEKNYFPDYSIALDNNDRVTFRNRHGDTQQSLALDDLPRLSRDTLRRAQKLVEDAGTGWDFGALHEQFTQQLMDGFRPEKVNGAFIGFVKKKIKTRP